MHLVCLTTTCKVDDFADNQETRSQESRVPCRGAQFIDDMMGLREQSLVTSKILAIISPGCYLPEA